MSVQFSSFFYAHSRQFDGVRNEKERKKKLINTQRYHFNFRGVFFFRFLRPVNREIDRR